ncbi:transmembrane protein 60 [Centruroides vittatus]|uniref:transmembrane protein 60-like n=1 Tax=Centruroides sculpturatus TaxID=218467 RepID=UPI000C6CBCEE|nr:transmembrane protein 60-like [Centruroides sculpturatus]
MAIIHKALATWVLGTIFLILFTLRLDEKIDWDSFIIFSPMWVFDVKVMGFVLFRIMIHCRLGHDHYFVTMQKKFWYLFCIFLKVAFQVLLCGKLKFDWSFSWYFVAIPLWMLLIAISGDVLLHLFGRRTY